MDERAFVLLGPLERPWPMLTINVMVGATAAGVESSCLGRCEKGLVTYEMRQQFGRLDGHASIPTSTWTSSESNTFQPTTRNLAVAEANLGTVAGDRLTTGTYLLCSRLNDSTAIRHSSEPGVGLAISSIASAVPKVRMTTKGKSRWPTAN